MKKPLQIISLSNPDFEELKRLLQPQYLVGKVEHEERIEKLYALPCFFVIEDSDNTQAISISPCRNQEEARESAANYLINARSHGLSVDLNIDE